MQYLKGTADFAIKYSQQPEEGIQLNVYSDADFAGDQITRRSKTGVYFFMLVDQ